MPIETRMSEGRRAEHDRRLHAAGRVGLDAVAIARDLQGNLAKMDALAETVVSAVLGRRKRTTKDRELQIHEIISSLHKRGVQILRAGPQNLTASQRRKHHNGIRSISSLLERSAKDAALLGERLSEIRKGFEAIRRLYNR